MYVVTLVNTLLFMLCSHTHHIHQSFAGSLSNPCPGVSILNISDKNRGDIGKYQSKRTA
jgi:hypothetical protein